MKKIFCSYAYTGEDKEVVESRMASIVEIFKRASVDVYCNLFDGATENYTNPKQFLDRAIEMMADYDTVFVIQTSARRSEGMLIEIGAAMAQKRTILLAQHKSAVGESYLSEIAEKTFVWETNENLYDIATKLVDK